MRWAVADARDWIARRPRVPRPPRAMVVAIGGSSFRLIGEEFLRLFRDLGGLPREARVLDVGCGCGRMAVPLAKWLTGASTYDGFDVDAAAVSWCREQITPRYPTFQFHVADVRNGHYRADAARDAVEWTFPWPDASFDFVFLTSVFTHMLPRDQERYVEEIARVLADGGTCFATFFLWNAEAAERLDLHATRMRFKHVLTDPGGEFRAMYPEKPEGALSIREEDARARFDRHGLAVVEPIHYGTWCRPRGASFQDVVVVRRRPRVTSPAGGGSPSGPPGPPPRPRARPSRGDACRRPRRRRRRRP